MKVKRGVYLAMGLLALCGILSGRALAASVTDTFQVQATVNAKCTVSAADMTFATAYDGSLGAPNDSGQSDITVNCTKNAPYEVGLDAGVTAGATIATRLMKNTLNADTMQYNLYTTAGRTTVWGNTQTVDTVTGTGNGLGVGQANTHTVFGRIPAGQTTLSVGTYQETTITATVYY
jgi:spore coat protein U domain-containing protein, fimbrial subunit CupE1/2/3/6